MRECSLTIQGISDFPACLPYDLVCKQVHALLSSGVYTEYAQTHSVTAQYFRDTRSAERFQKYLERNRFIFDINNEGATKNATYADNLKKLNKFVMIRFDEDTVRVDGWSALT